MLDAGRVGMRASMAKGGGWGRAAEVGLEVWQ